MTTSHATILCPGPPLADVHPDIFTGTVLTVNRAILKFPDADWLCCLDDKQIESLFVEMGSKEPPVAYKGGVFCSLEAYRAHNRHPYALRSGVSRWQIKESCDEIKGQPGQFTTTSAIMFAFTVLEAEEVAVYGTEMQGERDWDKGDDAVSRSPARWKREAEILRSIQDRYGNRLRIAGEPHYKIGKAEE